MDQAKAIINLKEGTVQLEGPVEFVREYLDRFAVKELAPRRREARGVAKAAPGVAPKPVRRARGPRARRISATDALHAEVEAGFFNEARAIPQVRQHLAEKGISYSTNYIRIGLKRLTESGLLGRTGAARALRYRVPST